MSDLQKAIEQNVRIIFNMGKLYERGEIEYDLSKGCNRIKFLLEQVAKEQKHIDTNAHCLGAFEVGHNEYKYDWDSEAVKRTQNAPLVTDNLTFNES